MKLSCCLKLLFISFTFVCNSPSWAQREADNWFFGNQAGFDFRQGPPQPLSTSSMKTVFGCTTISDKQTGQLLFYSNGEKVWNRLHQLMPNGKSIRGSNIVTQAALIIPAPSHPRQYYLFTLELDSNYTASNPDYEYQPCKLFYSLIDMSLDEGKGDVVTTHKDVFVASNLSQQLTAVAHANGTDYWVLTHQWQSDTFQIHWLKATGLSPAYLTTIGSSRPNHTNGPSVAQQVQGFLKASPDGTHLASTQFSGYSPVDLFDFNASTGTISNYIHLGDLLDAFGVSFSSDNSKLYIQNFSPSEDGKGHNLISQYNLKAGDKDAIISSGKIIYVANPYTNISSAPESIFYALQLAPDGKIYGASDYRSENGLIQNNFYVINQPNRKGFECDLQYQTFDFGSATITGGLPNFIEAPFNNLQPIDDTSIECKSSDFILFPNPSEHDFQVKAKSMCFQPYRIKIWDATGKVVKEYSLIDAELSPKIRIAYLPNGLYFVQIHLGKEKFVKKLIKLSQ